MNPALNAECRLLPLEARNALKEAVNTEPEHPIGESQQRTIMLDIVTIRVKHTFPQYFSQEK